MKKWIVRSAVTAVVFGLCFSCSVDDANAGAISGVATEWTQLLNHVQLVTQYEQQLQQYAKQIEQYQAQIQHLEQAYRQTDAMVTGIGSGNFNFSAIAYDLNALSGVVKYGEGLAYSMANLDEEFNTRFPGYSSSTATDYASRYKKWYSTNLDTAHAAMKVTGIQASQLASDAALVQKLQQQSQNSTTLLQTLQVSNSLAAQELAELEKLRQLMMTDIQSKATYQAQQAAEAQAGHDLNSTFFTVPTGSNSDSRTYGPLPSQK
jgi:type IV secretion system protein TrbJ